MKLPKIRTQNGTMTIHLRFTYPDVLSAMRRLITQTLAKYPVLKDIRVRASMIATAVVLVAAELIGLLQPYFTQHVYALGNADSLLSPIVQPIADKLRYDPKQQVFQFNSGYTQPESGTTHTTGTQIKATLPSDITKGISVTDPVHTISFTMTPKFGAWAGQQNGNRVVYPLIHSAGWAVYSVHSIGVKEDIILTSASGDSMTFDYRLGLSDGLAARLLPNCNLGIYGNALLSSNISTGSAKDAALLEKARQNAPKNTLLFSIPRPTIKALNPAKTSVNASYILNGTDLQLRVSGLRKANYPLTIDPSIYVSSAQQFMAGNNETNIDFDVADQLIQKGSTTGAQFNAWNPTLALNSSALGQGVAVAGGNIYVVGGTHTDGSTTYYSSPGTNTFVVPTAVTSITVKSWGAGGGGGGGGDTTSGGAGGGGGYAKATLTVTPGQSLTVKVGAGGGGGAFSSGSAGSSTGDGGGGGGYSGVFSGTTPQLVAAGGAGGGGGSTSGNTTYVGAPGGAGGGTSGIAGSASGGAGGGGGGTPTAGGAGGTGGGNSGAAGTSLAGGAGANGASGASTTGGNNNGGAPGGANGGNGDATTAKYAGGGGGGGGYFGGGGGSGGNRTGNGSNAVYTGGGGGGGGSSYTTGSSTSNLAGSGATPGNSSDGTRGSSGNGGSGGGVRGGGTSGNSGLVVITYGSGSTNTTTVNWAQFNASTGGIESADPGAGACSGWCAKSDYAFPVPRSNLSLVAYNGFLYAIGGEDSGCTAASGTGDNGVCNTVYIAKLGANGEPQLWNPTSTDKTTWTFWYKDTNLTSPRSYIAAVAYQNRMYLLGGKTSASGTASVVNTAQIADITATGQLSSWSSSTTLPYNVYGYGAQIYNGRIYLVGGDSSIGGTPLSSVYYNTINSDGTLNSWVQTSSLTGGRFTNGGNFTTVAGGYIYLSGGCTAVGVASSGGNYCSGFASDTQLASIGADGSLDQWTDDTSVSDARMGHNVVAWQNIIYEIGGCNAQSAATAECTSALSTINYGTINHDGDISSVTKSVASGTAPCSGASPTNCDLPPTSQVGQMLNATAVINGYLYVAGGCSNAACSTIASNTAYAAIGTNGALSAPANCTTDGNTLYGSWCVDSAHNINPGNQGNGNTGVAAAGTAVFGNTIYFAGGFNGNGETNVIYSVSVNTDGSLNTAGWHYDSLTTAGAVGVAYDYAYARANPSAAGTAPGNLFILGGCTALSGAACTTYTGAVYKCNILTNKTISGCTTTGQLQIGTVAGATGAGLAGTGGTVYANYVYLIGGQAPGISGVAAIYYAKIDNNNNIVAVSGSTWATASNSTPVATQYAAAYGYNGYLYVVGGYNSTSGVLNTVEFAEINVSNGDIGPFITSGITISATWGAGLPVSGSYGYILGGCSTGTPPSSCSVLRPTVQSFQIYNNDSGAPASYTTAANTYGVSPSRLGIGSAVLNGYLYVAGGCTSTTDCTTAVSDVSYAPLDANGTVGTWTSTTAPLPAVRTWGKLEAAGNSLYYIGGQSSTATDVRTEVYYATPSSGNISTWGTATNGLPAARKRFGAAVWNNRLYVVGGADITSTPTTTVYISPQLNSGGDITSAWTTSTSFNVARRDLTVVAYANNLYLFGGYDGANYLSDGQYTQISTTNGSIGSWSYTTSLPTAISGADGFAANGYIYVIGGTTDGTSCLPSTFVAPISANTTIASGNNPTGVGGWYQSSRNYSGNRYGAAAVYSNGKAYVLGGGCGSTLTYASPVIQQSSLLSQPQVAQYSIMFDTDTDVYPNYWLLNGVDNSIGAKWQLSYRSMSNSTQCTSTPMSTWGVTTNFGNVTLGTPGVYNPLDGSGTNIKCARYYFMSVTVDSSRAYGYPDDVTRGPTITDLTLQFTADPSKRLMHGRTFTGGLQQPDDTPYYAY